MTKEEKQIIIAELTEVLANTEVLYVTDISGLNAEETSKLRRICFQSNIEMKVVKNTLLRKAMENVEGKNFSEMYATLKGNSAILIAESGNAPAKMIKDFRVKNKKPILKSAYVQETVFTGDNQLEALVTLKTKNELIGEIIGLLQSPAKNVISALGSGGSKLAGIVKTLQEREN